jgi:hypothetical protein
MSGGRLWPLKVLLNGTRTMSIAGKARLGAVKVLELLHLRS